METAMRVVFTFTMFFIVSIAAVVRADPSSTQVSATHLSPKETLMDWCDHITSMNVDDLLRTYSFSGDKQKGLAEVTAEEVIAIEKLQKAVDGKWGKDAEATVMHACDSDTREDDEQAKETVNGDHAVITFKLDSISPLPLVRVDDQWKLDIGAFYNAIGEHLNDAEASTRQITVIVNSATAAIADGKYSDAGQLAKDLQAQIDKVQ
jgi:hypothetical protein